MINHPCILWTLTSPKLNIKWSSIHICKFLLLLFILEIGAIGRETEMKGYVFHLKLHSPKCLPQLAFGQVETRGQELGSGLLSGCCSWKQCLASNSSTLIRDTQMFPAASSSPGQMSVLPPHPHRCIKQGETERELNCHLPVTGQVGECRGQLHGRAAQAAACDDGIPSEPWLESQLFRLGRQQEVIHKLGSLPTSWENRMDEQVPGFNLVQPS